MDQSFLLPIELNGTELDLPTRLVQTGFTRKFVIAVDDKNLTVETDEEGELRILMEADSEMPGKDMIEAIVSTLKKLLA